MSEIKTKLRQQFTNTELIQQKILTACLDHGQFEQVKWLEVKDFKNYPGKPFRDCWELIKKTNNDFKQIWQHGGLELSKFMNDLALIPTDVREIQKLALILVEYNIFIYIRNIIEREMMESKAELQMRFLEQVLVDWHNLACKINGDILVGYKTIPGYVEPHVTKAVHAKIVTACQNVLKREKEIKKHL